MLNKYDNETNFIQFRKATLLREINREEALLEELHAKRGLKRTPAKTEVPEVLPPLKNQNHPTLNLKEYKDLQQRVTDLSYRNKIDGLIKLIPDCNGSRICKKQQLNVAIISDEFMINYYKDAANFTYLSNTNYKFLVNEMKFDMFMFVTGWKGLNGEWRGIASSEDKRAELLEVIDYIKSKGIPTIFQSIEDPSNYDNFIDIAQKCDYVFTTAIEKIDDYKQDCNHENVWFLEFGINPLFHNPVGFKKVNSFKDILFAGSWTNRYQERCTDMVTIFDGIIQAKREVKIIDRNFELKAPDYFFPEKYVKYSSPSVSHTELQKVHKLYDWAVNLNSIKYSQTMCAMRVYELQALGNIVLSNYSIAVNNSFPNIFIINNKEEVSPIINSFNDEDIYRHQLFGIRNVMTNHTLFDRFNFILEKCSVKHSKGIVSILVVVEKVTKKIQEMFDAQTYPNKVLMEKSAIDHSKLEQFEVVAFFDENINYLNFYLEDMCNAFKYTSSSYITKNIVNSNSVEHDYTSNYENKYTTVFWSSDFTLEELYSMGKAGQLDNGYCIDRYEVEINLQESINVENSRNGNFQLSVIVPIYNNGNHLVNKCFNSLKRSTIFKQMEVILVDDGSTDEMTKMLVNRLEKRFSNVKTYFFNDGGSGSASRPRNKGIELATSPYITFLDPDNEAVNDGYAVLLREILEKDYDFVIGHIKKITNKEVILRLGSPQIIDKPREYLINKNFKAQSIQAAMIKRELIIKNNLDMVVGSIGQDTLFFHELMLCASKVKVMDIVVHIYYAAVANSAVNSITKKFFEKSLLLEKGAFSRYKSYGVLEDYSKNKFEVFFRDWYLEKIKNVKPEDLQIATRILYSILDMYSEQVKLKDKEVIKFKKKCENKLIG